MPSTTRLHRNPIMHVYRLPSRHAVTPSTVSSYRHTATPSCRHTVYHPGQTVYYPVIPSRRYPIIQSTTPSQRRPILLLNHSIRPWVVIPSSIPSYRYSSRHTVIPSYRLPSDCLLSRHTITPSHRHPIIQSYPTIPRSPRPAV